MSTARLSRARLARMHDVMAGYVERGVVAGLVTLVSRRGEVYVDAIGAQALGDSPQMRRDTIFRISSMTRPITAVATMILVEECKLRLDDPVDRWLPELAERQVLKRLDGPLDDTVPASDPITVRDLLTFCMGFGQMMAPTDAYPILSAACFPVGSWRTGFDHRRLSGRRPDDALPGQTRRFAYPVEAVGRAHDDRPANARTEKRGPAWSLAF